LDRSSGTHSRFPPKRPVTFDFVVRPEAEADIEDTYAWYESRSAGLGDRFLDAVEATLGFVPEAPQRFPEKHREPDFTIRRALVEGFPYGVFFIWPCRDLPRWPRGGLHVGMVCRGDPHRCA